jgi:glycosyltransferase involved in cell wall biosynthesis
VKILFAWRRLPPPGFIGGAELSEGTFASWLARREEVTFLGSAEDPRNPTVNSYNWMIECLNTSQIKYHRHGNGIEWTWRGVKCILVSQRNLMSVAEDLISDTDLLWTSQEGCNSIRALGKPGLPAVTYAHSISEVGSLSARIDANVVFTPSKFVHHFLRNQSEAKFCILRPPVEKCCSPSNETAAPRGTTILFVNPVVEKGLERVIRLASLLPYKFRFVEGWRAWPQPGQVVPSNVEVVSRSQSMHQHYIESDVVVIPSVVQEGAGRVAIEAGLHRRPVIASASGGLVEYVAQGCLLDPRAPDTDWVRMIDKLMTSQADWRRASQTQYEVSKTSSANPETLFAEIDKVISSQ